jgi:hypothetical protein
MKAHPKHPEVQKNACAALWGLAVKGLATGFSGERNLTLPLLLLLPDFNQITIAKKGGIELILRAMKLHPYYSDLQEKACGALWNLAVNSRTFLKKRKEKKNETLSFFFSSHIP